MTAASRFPPDFLWGVAASAFQIEGSPLADGAGQSIWHRYLRTPGRVPGNATGDVACDHYNRWREDVALMASLGFGAYRFSIAWSRVLPEGRGRINNAGLDFYKRLVDALLDAGIEPVATLFHWDLPAALDDAGGWLNRDIAGWFADYADVLYRALDGRIRKWGTINEPWVVADGGYLRGTIAPGHCNLYEAPIAAHNLLRAHGAAVQAYRAVGKHTIGPVINLEPKIAASENPDDLAAAQRDDAYMNRQYLDPIMLGEYPAEMADIFGDAWPDWPAADLELIRQPVDWVGVNYYTRSVVRHDPGHWPVLASPVRQARAVYTDMGWEVHPPSFTDTLLWVRERYGNPAVYVTENGAAFPDPPTAANGSVHDPARVEYFRDHLRALADALERGANVRGYMAWSLLDNLEWSLGYAMRFGIVHVNFDNLVRTPKDSARLLSEVVASNGSALDADRP